MSALALSKLPYWRWHRYHRAKGNFKPRGAAVKPWNGIVIVALLLVLDQYTKHSLVSLFGSHNVSDTWLIGPAITTLLLTPFLVLRRFQVAAAFGIAGAMGNFISVIATGSAPNPFLLSSNGSDITAFNAADVFLVVGFALTLLAAAKHLIAIRPRRHSHAH